MHTACMQDANGMQTWYKWINKIAFKVISYLKLVLHLGQHEMPTIATHTYMYMYTMLQFFNANKSV